MPSLTTAPARWPALLLLSLVALQGCSLLPGARDKADSDDTTATIASDTRGSRQRRRCLTLDVRGPDARAANCSSGT